MSDQPPTKRKCLGADCDNDAGSLQCPTCLKLKIKDSYFCSQDCFKRNWVTIPPSSPHPMTTSRRCETDFAAQNTHKVIHKQENSMIQRFFPPKVVSKPDPDTGAFNPFPTFNFTGSLRPVYPLSPRRQVPKSIPHPDYSEDGIPKSGRSLVRSNKIEQLDAKAQEGMRKVCRLAREVLDIAAAALRPGISTDEIDEVVHKACIERNVGEPLAVQACPPLICLEF